MAILDIRTYPYKILLQKANPVVELNGWVQDLIDSMIETMYAVPGLGLAAPQVAVSQRDVLQSVKLKEPDFSNSNYENISLFIRDLKK